MRAHSSSTAPACASRWCTIKCSRDGGAHNGYNTIKFWSCTHHSFFSIMRGPWLHRPSRSYTCIIFGLLFPSGTALGLVDQVEKGTFLALPFWPLVRIIHTHSFTCRAVHCGNLVYDNNMSGLTRSAVFFEFRSSM